VAEGVKVRVGSKVLVGAVVVGILERVVGAETVGVGTTGILGMGTGTGTGTVGAFVGGAFVGAFVVAMVVSLLSTTKDLFVKDSVSLIVHSGIGVSSHDSWR